MEFFKPLIGFSTGSIALGDFSAGITYLKEKEIDVIELSTLREFELINFLKNIDLLDVSSFKYISFHAPSKLTTLNEHEFVSLLKIVAAKKWLIIVHPDIIEDFELWDKSLGNLLCIENMDKRKHIGRTAADLEYIFEKLPQASFCFDVAHARQVDSTMSEAKLMISKFKHRLKQVHLSDVNSESKHESLSLESLLAYSTLFENIPKTIPVILESPIDKQNLEREIKTASLIFNPEKLVDFIKPYGKHSNYFRYYIDYFSKHHSE